MNISISLPLTFLAVLLSQQALADRENDMWQQFKAQKGMSELDAEFAEPAPAPAPEPEVRVVERIVEVERVVEVEVPAAAAVPQTVPAPEPVTAVVEPSMVTAESDGYVIKFGNCKLAHRNIKCHLSVLNTEKDGTLTVLGSYYQNSSRLYDRNGNEYIPASVSMANKTNDRSVKNRYIQGVVTKGTIDFKNVSAETKAISLFELSIRNGATNKYNRLQFRDVALSM